MFTVFTTGRRTPCTDPKYNCDTQVAYQLVGGYNRHPSILKKSFVKSNSIFSPPFLGV